MGEKEGWSYRNDEQLIYRIGRGGRPNILKYLFSEIPETKSFILGGGLRTYERNLRDAFTLGDGSQDWVQSNGQTPIISIPLASQLLRGSCAPFYSEFYKLPFCKSFLSVPAQKLTSLAHSTSPSLSAPKSFSSELVGLPTWG